MNGAQYVISALRAHGVDVVFGYPGGAIMPVYDAIHDAVKDSEPSNGGDSDPLRHILVRHEQGAALAADGYARASGRVGVCLATSGPGATNLLTGLANAALDSVPVVAITGQVATPLMGTDAFQEVDIIGMSLPVVKHSFQPRCVEELQTALPEAFRIAQQGRPGPVLIDLPKDITQQEITGPYRPALLPTQTCTLSAQLANAVELLLACERPIIYCGGGVHMGDAVAAFRHFAEVTGIPTVCTLKGLGNLPGDHPLSLGMLGMHGHPAANLAVQECDLLVVVGARFDDRATGKLDTFAPTARVIHLDIDPSEIDKLRQSSIALVGELTPHLDALTIPLAKRQWAERCTQRKNDGLHRPRTESETHAEGIDTGINTGIYAPQLLRDLSTACAHAPQRTVVSCDVGQHQMWVAQQFQFSDPRDHLTSGGLGTMGYGIPAALGAQLADPDARVIAVTGDGSILMNVQELATLRRYQIPVKILLFDNSALGMVRQWQELFFDDRLSEVDLSDNPDFVEVANAFGIPAMRVESTEQCSAAIDAIVNSDGPLLVHVKINPRENVWPLVPPGASNAEMISGELS